MNVWKMYHVWAMQRTDQCDAITDEMIKDLLFVDGKLSESKTRDLLMSLQRRPLPPYAVPLIAALASKAVSDSLHRIAARSKEEIETVEDEEPENLR